MEDNHRDVRDRSLVDRKKLTYDVGYRPKADIPRVMTKKSLQSVANDLCPLVVGWRMNDANELLASLPDGVVTIDILHSRVTHSDGSALEFHIQQFLSDWLRSRLEKSPVALADLVVAEVELAYRTDRIRTDRTKIVSFDFECRSAVGTAAKTYEGTLSVRNI